MLAMIGLIVVFAEILPRTIAHGAPDRVSLLVARPIALMMRLLGPVLVAIDAIVRWMLGLAGVRVDKVELMPAGHDEMRGSIDLVPPMSGGSKQERDLLDGLLDLQDLTVSDVMVHRTEMITVNADDPPQDILKVVLAAPVTRVPLWRESPENIVGVLHAKDLLRAIQATEGDLTRVDIPKLARPPWFVPDIRPLSEQLKAFRRRKTYFALVVDEYGEVMGIVTLEDILEEIVGDISDEHEVAIAGVRPQSDGSVSVDGAVPIRDLNRVMDWNLPDEEATTVAGLVIHEARLIPEPGQSFTFHGFRFRVLQRERNRITSLRITPLARSTAMAKTA
jgi:Mg2+/Co2+ transporter CorB